MKNWLLKFQCAAKRTVAVFSTRASSVRSGSVLDYWNWSPKSSFTCARMGLLFNLNQGRELLPFNHFPLLSQCDVLTLRIELHRPSSNSKFVVVRKQCLAHDIWLCTNRIISNGCANNIAKLSLMPMIWLFALHTLKSKAMSSREFS